MTTELYTIQDASASAPGGAEDRALLLIYYTDVPEPHTEMVELPSGVDVTFGRSSGATVQVHSELVSRQHAIVHRHGNDITLEDLGSSNGTTVNGSRVQGKVPLHSGDEVVIGPATIIVHATSQKARELPVRRLDDFEERLAAECYRGRRYQRGFGLVMLQLGGQERATDHALSALVSSLSLMDVIAEYGPDEFILLLPELDPNETQTRVETLIGGARQGVEEVSGAVRLNAGFACFPTHGIAPAQLMSRARSALAAAVSSKSTVAGAEAEQREEGYVEPLVINPQMRRVYQLARQVADHNMTVLINGETGAGKELVAAEIHHAGRRRKAPFLKLNCASLPGTLLESELFGHERGAFTGADRRKIGFFEAAEGGTLFLDEIGDAEQAVQSKLLRVLETQTIMRVGGTTEIPVDTRVVCATNRNLEEDVREGKFREDLLYRIGAFTILVPPLRDRRDEIPELAKRFLTQLASDRGQDPPPISAATIGALCAHDWPGNVRELRNAIERAYVVQSGTIEPEDLPPAVSTKRAAATPAAEPIQRRVDDFERAELIAALDSCGGNQTRAARRLGLSRRTLIYRMEKHGLKELPAHKKKD